MNRIIRNLFCMAMAFCVSVSFLGAAVPGNEASANQAPRQQNLLEQEIAIAQRSEIPQNSTSESAQGIPVTQPTEQPNIQPQQQNNNQQSNNQQNATANNNSHPELNALLRSFSVDEANIRTFTIVGLTVLSFYLVYKWYTTHNTNRTSSPTKKSPSTQKKQSYGILDYIFNMFKGSNNTTIKNASTNCGICFEKIEGDAIEKEFIIPCAHNKTLFDLPSKKLKSGIDLTQKEPHILHRECARSMFIDTHIEAEVEMWANGTPRVDAQGNLRYKNHCNCANAGSRYNLCTPRCPYERALLNKAEIRQQLNNN